MVDLDLLNQVTCDLTQRIIFRCSRDAAMRAAFSSDPRQMFDDYGFPIKADIVICEDSRDLAHFVVLFPQDIWTHFRTSGSLSDRLVSYLQFCEDVSRDQDLRQRLIDNPHAVIDNLPALDPVVLNKQISVKFDTPDTKHLVVNWEYYESINSDLEFEILLSQKLLSGKTIAETGTATGSVGRCSAYLPESVLPKRL